MASVQNAIGLCMKAKAVVKAKAIVTCFLTMKLAELDAVEIMPILMPMHM